MPPWPADHGDGGGPAEEAPPPGAAAKRARVDEHETRSGDHETSESNQQSSERTSSNDAGANADSGGVELYCVCRQPADDDRSMIGCDGCDEWFHIECVNVSEEDLKRIKTYFCARCSERDPSLVTKVKATKKTTKKKTTKKKSSEDVREANMMTDADTPNDAANDTGSGAGLEQHVAMDSDDADSDDDAPIVMLPTTKTKKNKKRPRSGGAGAAQPRANDASEAAVVPPRTPTPQPPPPPRTPSPPPPPICASEGCAARCTPPSKYCSRACGLTEADKRVRALLQREIPPATTTADLACEADRHDLLQIANLDEHHVDVAKRLAELEVLRSDLKACVARAAALGEPDAADKDVPPDPSAMIDCFSCHESFPLGRAQGGIIPHLHKCFLKLEAEVMLTADQPRPEARGCPVRSFCNVYDKATRTYCSRFFAMCPRHGESAKFSFGRAGEVCGYPLNAGDPTSTAVCTTDKRRCLEHAAWEKLHRARYELETVQLCMYREYLDAAKSAIAERLARRHTLLSLATHGSVTVHTYADAEAIAKRALAGAETVRAQLDAASATAASARAAVKSNELTGGSLNLPQRHWR